jgi:peptide/nickel transport system permease protein
MSTPGRLYDGLKQVDASSPDYQYVQAGKQQLEETYKLDKPWPLNYLTWLFDPGDTIATTYTPDNKPITTTKGIDLNIFGAHIRGSGMLTLDFGTSASYAYNTPISQYIGDAWASTARLLAASFLLTLLFGLPLGIIAALRQRRALDHDITFFSLGGRSFPPFVLGLILIIFLAVLPAVWRYQTGWSWLPSLPTGEAGISGNFWDQARHLVLPAFTLAIPQIAWLTQYTRFAMLDVLHQDYIRTALAKGVGKRRVVFKHALRNTLIPVITQLALLTPLLISAVMVVETVFAYPGLGKAFFRAMGGCLAAVSNLTADPPPCPKSGFLPMDYPFALALLLISLVLVAVSNLIADILYTVVDPRISFVSDKK